MKMKQIMILVLLIALMKMDYKLKNWRLTMNKKGLIIIILAIISFALLGCYFISNIMNRMFINDPNINVSELQKLPIPALLEDENPDENISDFYLNVQQGKTYFFKELATTTLGYNSNFLGPVIKVKRGQLVNMHVQNDLAVSTSVHWHGLEVPGEQDGGPHQKILAGSTWNPSFMIDQPASTLWFHPHVMGTTATQVYYGLAGLLIIEDENSLALNLPNEYGVNDFPLIIQDRSFKSDGSFLYNDTMMDGVVGDYIIVNGAITPYLDVNQVKMRFRIVNGANASNFNLKLSNNNSFFQIASDGGLLESPIEMTRLFISPGERAEIIIDFSKYQSNDKVVLLSGGQVVMTFNIKDKVQDLSELPTTLSIIERLDVNQATALKTIRLDGMGHMVTINGKQFDMDRIDDNVNQYDTQIWEISAPRQMMMGGEGHPFHIHGTQFQILSRNGREPNANEMGWKDTVFVNSGETVRIIVQFKHKGIFMYHCHILEHEEAGMMGQLIVN